MLLIFPCNNFLVVRTSTSTMYSTQFFVNSSIFFFSFHCQSQASEVNMSMLKEIGKSSAEAEPITKIIIITHIHLFVKTSSCKMFQYLLCFVNLLVTLLLFCTVRSHAFSKLYVLKFVIPFTLIFLYLRRILYLYKIS